MKVLGRRRAPHVGNLLGVPGAPERLAQNSSRDAAWTVCDDSSGPGVTVIAGALGSGGERATELQPHHAVLVQNEGRTWLLWDGRRSQIDLANHAVTNALGLSPGVKTITYNYPGPSGALTTTFEITVPQNVPAMPVWAWVTLSMTLGFVVHRALRKPPLAS